MADTPTAQNGTLIIDPYGQYRYIQPDQVADAVKSGGFKIPSADETHEFGLKQQYSQEPGKAFLESAASGATFGGSRWLERQMGVDPEAMAAREKYNPTASTLGSAAGVVGPLLAPEVGAAESLVGKAASIAGAPVQAVSKAGRAVTEAALPVAEKAAGLAAKEGSFAHKVLSQAAAQGSGAALEGAVYGAGQGVDEAALGDPNLNAEKLLSHVGMSAMLAGGLGTALGLTGTAAHELLAMGRNSGASLPQALAEAGVSTAPPLTELEQAARYGAPGTEAGQSLRSAIGIHELPKEAQATFTESLSKLKTNSDEILGALRAEGAPAPEGMISDSPEIQRIESMLNTAPGPTGAARNELYGKVYDAGSNAISQSVGGHGIDMSLAELGGALQKSLGESFEAKAGPIQELYDQIGEYTKAVPVTEQSAQRIAGNIRKLVEEHALVKGFPEHGFVNTMADAVEGIKDLDTLKNVRTAMGRASGKETRFVSGLIKEKLDSLEENAIKRLAKEMKNPEAKAKVMGLIDQIDQAKTGYKALRGEMQDIGGMLWGKAKIYGPQDFLDKIAETTPEKFAQRLFAKNNSRALEKFAKNFPEQMKLIAQYQRSAIRDAAMKSGDFQPKLVLKQLDKLSPEVKKLLFAPEELTRLERGRLILDNMPKDWNPSHTSSMEAYRHYYSHPIRAAAGETYNRVALGVIKRTVGQDPRFLSALSRVENMAKSTTKAISTGAKEVFSGAKTLAAPISAGAAGALMGKDKKSKQDRFSQIHELNSSPEKLMDTLEEHGRSLYAIAPNTSSAATQAAVRATQFLASKIPQTPPPMPLSPKLPHSQSDVAKFERYHALVESPVAALAQVRDGTITPETIETLNTVYPKLYQEMKTAVMEEMTDHVAKEGQIPYRTKMALSLFMGTPMDHTMTPQAIQMAQMSAKVAPQAQQTQNPAQPATQKHSSAALAKYSQTLSTGVQAREAAQKA